MSLPFIQPVILTCGNCTLCCKVLKIETLQKPKDQWCTHARQKQGCGIYADRPEECRTFECMWLRGALGTDDRYKPNKIHAVLIPTIDGKNFVIQEDPGYPGYATQILKNVIQTYTSGGNNYVVVVCGESRTFFGNPKLFQALTEVNT